MTPTSRPEGRAKKVHKAVTPYWWAPVEALCSPRLKRPTLSISWRRVTCPKCRERKP